MAKSPSRQSISRILRLGEEITARALRKFSYFSDFARRK